MTLDRLDTLRAAGELPPNQTDDSIPQLGIARMNTSSNELAQRFGIEPREGVIIEKIVPESELASVAVPGSVIVAVMDFRITNTSEFLQLLSRYDLRAGVVVSIIRPDGQQVTTRLRVQS